MAMLAVDSLGWCTMTNWHRDAAPKADAPRHSRCSTSCCKGAADCNGFEVDGVMNGDGNPAWWRCRQAMVRSMVRSIAGGLWAYGGVSRAAQLVSSRKLMRTG